MTLFSLNVTWKLQPEFALLLTLSSQFLAYLITSKLLLPRRHIFTPIGRLLLHEYTTYTAIYANIAARSHTKRGLLLGT